MFLRVSFLIFIVLGILSRVLFLDNIPGLNGDEAWYGIQLFKILNGNIPDFIAPTGRWMMNPFFMGPLAAVQFFFEPQFWILRVPSLLFGLLTIGLGYFIIKDRFGKIAALALSSCLSTTPILIAYSRFGWDPSLLPFFALLTLWSFFEGKYYLGALFFVFGLINHPIFIFLAPAVAMIALDRRFDQNRIHSHYRNKNLKVILAGGMFLVVVVSTLSYWIPSQYIPALNYMKNNIMNITDFLSFIDYFGGLFGNSTVLTYIVDKDYINNNWTGNSLTLIVFLFAYLLIFVFNRKFFKTSGVPIRGLALGLLFSLISLYIVAGETAVKPHYERYGIFLVAPFIWLLILSVSPWLKEIENNLWKKIYTNDKKNLLKIKLIGIVSIIILFNGLNLFYFTKDYFTTQLITGGLSHPTFKTNSVEPKLEAWKWIQNKRQDMLSKLNVTESSLILTESWWLTKPLEFLAGRKSDQKVIDITLAQFAWENLHAGDFFVVFYGSSIDQIIKSNLKKKYEMREFGTYGNPHFIVAYAIVE